MKRITKVSMVSVLVSISVVAMFSLAFAQPPKLLLPILPKYEIIIVEASLTMTPAEVKPGMPVTISFSVVNNGATLNKAEILVSGPCGCGGKGGHVLDALKNQVINPGITTYTVKGIFKAPKVDEQCVLIEVYDTTKKIHPTNDTLITKYIRKLEIVSPSYKLK
jgi:hypothetical protein